MVNTWNEKPVSVFQLDEYRLILEILILVDRCVRHSAFIGVERNSGKVNEELHALLAGMTKTSLSSEKAAIYCAGQVGMLS